MEVVVPMETGICEANLDRAVVEPMLIGVVLVVPGAVEELFDELRLA